MRRAQAARETRETRITVVVEPGEAVGTIATGYAMFDHLLEQLAFHGRLGLRIEARSLDGLQHHLVEDVAIVLGSALRDALGDRVGIVRYACETLVMDEALVRAAVDLGGRSFARVELGLERERVEDLATELIPHFFSSLASNAGIALHIDRLTGSDTHHVVEAAWKALARALRAAAAPDVDRALLPSTKGVMVE